MILNQDHPDGSGSGAKREKMLLAAALVLNGVATPAEVEETTALLNQAKRILRARK